MSVLLAEPQTRTAATAADHLANAAAALDRAVHLLQTEGSRVARWRIVTQLLETRNAFIAHTELCRAADGPLRHITRVRPRLEPDVRGAIGQHQAILRQLDGLVASLTVHVGDESNGAAVLASTLKVSSALITHQRRTTAIVFEWANRDIGGES
jgi:hypothetical protein